MTSYTPQLAAVQVDQTQPNKYLTINTALSALDGAGNKLLLSNTTGAWNISEANFTRYAVFKAMGRAGAFDITLPDSVNVTNPERVFIVWNADTTYTATVKALSTPGTTVTLKPGQFATCYRNGVDTVAITLGYVAGSAPYDAGFFVPSTPADAGVVLELKATRAFYFADNFVGSSGVCATNPTGSSVFTVLKNGVSIGTITVSTLGVFTFATSGSGNETFAVGDILKVTAPTPQDATLADVGVLFYGTRTGF